MTVSVSWLKQKRWCRSRLLLHVCDYNRAIQKSSIFGHKSRSMLILLVHLNISESENIPMNCVSCKTTLQQRCRIHTACVPVFFFSWSIGWVTPKIIYFHYLKKHFLVQRIQKNRLFTFEKGSTDVYTDLPDAAHTLLQLNVSSTWLAWNVQKQWIMLHSWKLVWSKELLEILRLQTRSSENREQCVCFWN